MRTELLFGIHPVTVALQTRRRTFFEVFLKARAQRGPRFSAGKGDDDDKDDAPQLAKIGELVKRLQSECAADGVGESVKVRSVTGDVLAKILRSTRR
jgi:hypothetical protein